MSTPHRLFLDSQSAEVERFRLRVSAFARVGSSKVVERPGDLEMLWSQLLFFESPELDDRCPPLPDIAVVFGVPLPDCSTCVPYPDGLLRRLSVGSPERAG